MTRSAWRIVRADRMLTAFDGEGARRYGGRWNHPGTQIVYCASSRALALLELLANAPESHLEMAYVFVRAEFDSTLIRRVDASVLPRHWANCPAPSVTKDFGSRWAARNESAVLQVPSALVHEEMNFLLNPKHPDFRKIRIGTPTPVRLDSRLGGKKK